MVCLIPPCCWVSKAEYLQRRWQACIEARAAKALTEGEAFHGVAQKCLLVVSNPWEVASRTFPLISPSSLSLPRQARPPLATLTPRMSKSNYLNTAAASEQNGGECNEGGNPAIKIRLHEDLCILTPATWQLLSASFCVILTTTIKESFLLQEFQFDKKTLVDDRWRWLCLNWILKHEPSWTTSDLQGNVPPAFVVAAPDTSRAQSRQVVCAKCQFPKWRKHFCDWTCDGRILLLL